MPRGATPGRNLGEEVATGYAVLCGLLASVVLTSFAGVEAPEWKCASMTRSCCGRPGARQLAHKCQCHRRH